MNVTFQGSDVPGRQQDGYSRASLRKQVSGCQLTHVEEGNLFFSTPFPEERPQFFDCRLQPSRREAVRSRSIGQLRLRRQPQFVQRITRIEVEKTNDALAQGE